MVSVEGTVVRRQGGLFIVSGPSGSGKTSIATPVLAAFGDMRLSVSVTTRAPRPGERDGVDYHFIDDAEFARRVGAGELAEWAEVHGRRYGTPRAPIDHAIAEGSDLLLDIDVQGASQIKRAYSDAVSVFLLPPSRAHLEERLVARGTDDRRYRRAAPRRSLPRDRRPRALRLRHRQRAPAGRGGGLSRDRAL